jgi:hypothetical protein
MNRGISWDEASINRYRSKINFRALSSNPSVKWSIELIKRYLKLWDWEELSCNIGIDFNFEMISCFDEMWYWKPSDKYYFNESKVTKKSLCSNRNITWDLRIVDKYYDKIDFWRISLYGIVKEDVILKYHKEFDRKEKCGWQYHKWSDFRVDDDIVESGWQNFVSNPRTLFSTKLIEFFKGYETILTYSNDNLAYVGERINETITLLELFKGMKYFDLNIDNVIQNEKEWGNVFFNNEFINPYLCETSIKPILSEENMIRLLEDLRNS